MARCLSTSECQTERRISDSKSREGGVIPALLAIKQDSVKSGGSEAIQMMHSHEHAPVG